MNQHIYLEIDAKALKLNRKEPTIPCRVVPHPSVELIALRALKCDLDNLCNLASDKLEKRKVSLGNADIALQIVYSELVKLVIKVDKSC